MRKLKSFFKESPPKWIVHIVAQTFQNRNKTQEEKNMAKIIERFVVMAAGEDDMERYGTYETLEKAKSVADGIRTWNPGTIYVYRETIIRSEDLYIPQGRPFR